MTRSRYPGTAEGGAKAQPSWTGPLLASVLAACSASVGSGSSGAPGMEVLPTSGFVATGPEGGPFDASATYTIANTGETDLFWSAAPSAAWVEVSELAGTVPAGESRGVLVSVEATVASALADGQYAAAIVFTDLGSGATAAVVAASLAVQAPGQSGSLAVTPTTVAKGGPKGGPFSSPSQTLTLSNPGPGPVSWSAASNRAWLSLSQSAGTVAAGGQQQVTATLQAAANSLATGKHAGKVTFSDTSSGVPLAQVDVTLGIGTTIENQSWLNVHGQPFLPIGVWNQPPWQGQVTYLKSLGINTYLNNGLTPPEATNPDLLDLMTANDMWAILKFDPAVKDHPRVLGWLLGDEPDLYNVPVATVQQEYDAIRAADPDHFIALNTTAGFYWDGNYGSSSVESLYQGYTAIPDIASFDMYPVTGWNQQGWVYLPGAMTGFLRQHYLHGTKPVWAIVEASDQGLSWTPPNTPGPTAAQMRFEAWDAILHGATAVHYFTIAFDPFAWTDLTPAIEQELTRTNGQITALAPVILSTPPALSVTSSALGGLDHNFMLRRQGASTFLFADNADMGYRSETITFTFPQPISSVTVWGEGRSLTPSGNSFSDTFAPLEVHIYDVRF